MMVITLEYYRMLIKQLIILNNLSKIDEKIKGGYFPSKIKVRIFDMDRKSNDTGNRTCVYTVISSMGSKL